MPGDRHRPTLSRPAVVGACAVVLLLVLQWYAVFHLAPVDRLDRHVFHVLRGLAVHPALARIANDVADLCDPVPYAFLAAVPMLVALGRRRPLAACLVLLVLCGATETTQILKPLLGAHRPAGLAPRLMSDASWPSGHTTAAAALAAGWFLAVPRRLRRYVGTLGLAFVGAVGVFVVVLGWHYPSDAVAGACVGALWALCAVAARSRLTAVGPGRRRATGTGPDPRGARLRGWRRG